MLTFERANELFRYDPISGKVFRKVTTSSRSIKGTEAGSLDKRERYLRVTVDGAGYQLHRVIMLLVHGHLGKSVHVDHISHDRADNRLCNLRLVSLSENNKNKSMDRRNSTWVTGVKFNKKYNIGTLQNQETRYITLPLHARFYQYAPTTSTGEVESHLVFNLTYD